MPDWGPIFAPHVRDRWQSRIYFGAGPVTVASFIQRDKPVYLATPYTKRAQKAGKWAHDLSLLASAQAARELGRLARVGVTGLSPIVQSAEMVHAEAFERIGGQERLDPLDAAYWEGWCRPLLNVCCAVVVPAIDGWADSEGICAEVMHVLTEGNRPVFFYAGVDDV
jgi:Domain of unknown function (DUF1937)